MPFGLTDDLCDERNARQRMERALEQIKIEAVNEELTASDRLLRIVGLANIGLTPQED